MSSQSSAGAPSSPDQRPQTHTTSPPRLRPIHGPRRISLADLTGDGGTQEKPSRFASRPSRRASFNSLQDESSHLREATVFFEGNKYSLKTNADKRSRELRLETRGSEIQFRAVSPTHAATFTTLHWKLENDIFSLYGDGDLPPRQDKRLCKSLECLGALLAAQLFDEPWNDVDVASPISGGDLGLGQFINVQVSKLYRHGYEGHSSSFSPALCSYSRIRHSDSSREGLSARRSRRDPFLSFLRQVEVMTAQKLYCTVNLPTEVASVIGVAEHPVLRRVYGVFNPTVPTLYGLFLAKFAKFRDRHFRSRSAQYFASETSHTRTFPDSMSESDSSPDLEVGDGIALSSSEDEFVGDAGNVDLKQKSVHVTQTVEHSTSRQEIEKLHDSPRDENGQDELSSPQDVPALNSPESQNQWDTLPGKGIGLIGHPPPVSESDGSGDLGVAPLPLQRSAGLGKRGHKAIDRRLRHVMPHRRHKGPFDHHHPGYKNFHAPNNYAAHVAKDLFMILLLGVAIILSIVTVILDPAGEENWFKRIEEGAFVLFTLGIPIVLAMQSRLTDNLDLLMPAVSRPVRSIQDFKNMNKGMDHEIFLKQLAKAILVDKDISDLFSFTNACYKISRSDGCLVIPETTTYNNNFKEVWVFGAELCFNKLTGEAFKYLQKERILMIDRQPANVDGVIVHLRRKDKDYRIGEDPGN